MPSDTAATNASAAGKTSQDAQRRDSPAKFAKLDDYKRQANPEAYGKRQEAMDEMRSAPKGVLGNLWDSVTKGASK